MIKLVAIDIDGTLVNEKKIVTDKVRQAIHAAMDQGVKIVLCTGRPIAGIRPYLEELRMQAEDDFVISQNGAVITRTDTGEVIEKWPLALADVRQWYEFGKDFAANFLVMNEEHFHLVMPEGEEPSIRTALLDEGKTVRMAVEVADINALQEEYLKLLFFGKPAEIDEVEAAIPPAFRENFAVVRSQVYLLEVAAKGIDKGKALTKLAQDLGYAHEEVMAIGDGNNDYEMIKAAGLGVVMENGTDHLKSVANELTLSNENDGVAHAIEKFVLK